MSTIRSSIQLFDNVSPALRAMNKAMNIAVNSFEAMQTASSHAVDNSSIAQMRTELSKAEVAFDQVEQEIKQAEQAQTNFNNDVRNGGVAADGLKSKIISMAGAVGAAFSAKKIIELADTMTQTTARLNLMNDGLQTTEELQNRILASANRSRAAYQTTADAVSKMGIMAKDAFSSADEIIAFTEQINKQFTIAGTSAAGIDAAMLQLTQAMASGVLRGEELNSIFEQAPTIIQSIADYLNVPIGQIRSMAAEGQITANIIKNAMFATADETNAKFTQMPMTFVQVWTILQNTLLQAFEPIIQTIGAGAQWVYDNWATIEPVFWGLSAAVVAYTAGLGIMKIATIIQTIAQEGLNSTLLACPLTWIALAIGAVVAIIYNWVQSVGGLSVAWKICSNAIMDVCDKMRLGFKIVTTNIANFMGDMKVNVLTILQNMINSSINMINNFIAVLNKIPGVSINTVASVTFGTRAQLENAAAKSARNNELAVYRTEIASNAAARDYVLLQKREAARDVAQVAQPELGSNIRFNMPTDAGSGAIDIGNTLDGVFNNTADTAGNTASMVDSMNSLDDSLEYMMDVAEREVINRFTTAEIRIEQTNNNNISSDMDIDSVMDRWNNDFTEVLEIAAEGVHD